MKIVRTSVWTQTHSYTCLAAPAPRKQQWNQPAEVSVLFGYISPVEQTVLNNIP